MKANKPIVYLVISPSIGSQAVIADYYNLIEIGGKCYAAFYADSKLAHSYLEPISINQI